MNATKSAMTNARERLIIHINRKDWWHVPPADPSAYKKRGKFFSSTYRESEFYGRPLDEPERVSISNPLVGDEDTIESNLLGRISSEAEREQLENPVRRLALDAKLKRAAISKGYDSIVLMSPKSFSAYKAQGKIPISIELNILELTCCGLGRL
jgi:hypothetical protein